MQAPPVAAGQLLQQNQTLLTPGGEGPLDDAKLRSPDSISEPSSHAQKTLHVKRFMLSEVLPEPLASQVRALLATAEERDLTFAQITQVRLKLNALLRKHYGVLVFAVLPEQDARGGTLRFDIVRGHVEDVSLRNKSRVSDALLKRIFHINGKREVDLAEVVHAAEVARATPGVGAVTPVLSAGDTQGGTKVQVDIEPQPALQTALVMDNGGSPASGRYRLGTQLLANSPLGIGDQAKLTAYGAPGMIQNRSHKGGYTWIGLTSYDVPLSPWGTRGGIQFSRVQYALDGPLQGLGNGFAEVTSAYVNHPLVLKANDTVQVGVTLSRKDLSDEFFDFNFRRRSNVADFSLSGMHYGQAFGRANGIQFGLSLDAGQIKQLDVGLGDPSTVGGFVKWNGTADFTQLLWRGADVRAHVSAQLANRHLDSSEQMTLGGPSAVRAYGYDAPSVDLGAIVSLDLTQQIAAEPGLSTRAFVDVGQGTINRDLNVVGKGDTWTAMGYGVGLSYQYRRLRVDVSQAFRIGTPGGQRPAHSQTWVTASAGF